MRFSVPLKVFLRTRKRDAKDQYFILNLNEYRNAHHRILNDAKAAYKAEVMKVAGHLPALPAGRCRYRMEFVLYPGTRRRTDVANVCSIVDKFVCDALVEMGTFEDDDYTVIAGSSYTFGAVDKDNPRCDVEIKEL